MNRNVTITSFILCIAVVALSSAEAATYCVVPSTNMVSWWTGDAGKQDLYGVNNPSAVNAVSIVPAKVSNGFMFGTKGYIDIPFSSSLANQKFTLAAWVRPEGPGPNNDQYGSTITGQDFDSDHALKLSWRATDDRFLFVFGSLSSEIVLSNDTFPAGTFYFVAATYDGDTFRLYVNGVLEGSQVETKEITYQSSNWEIGSSDAYFRASGQPRTWNGVLDEVQVYKVALAAPSIQAIYKAGSAGECKVPVVLTSTSETLASQAVGTTGPAKTVTILNNRNESSTTCGSTLAGRNTCKVSVTFTPQAAGEGTAVLNVNDSVIGSPQTVGLSGNVGWKKGFDFRNTANFVTDPPGATDVLVTTLYPTPDTLTPYGWDYYAEVQGVDRSTMVDRRLAGINYARNGTPASFDVDLPAAGTYNLALAMGDEGYTQCWTQCQVQFWDGSTLLKTVAEGEIQAGYFYDATGKTWSAARWPASNQPLTVTLAGTRLTVIVGTNNNTGDITPIAYLGVTQVSAGPTFALEAPDNIRIGQGEYTTADVSTVLIGAFNNAISLSASGAPTGTTVRFEPTKISSPGAGTSIMTITIPSSTALGDHWITVTGTGGGITQNIPVLLTVTAPVHPNFMLTVPPSIGLAAGSAESATVTTTIMGSFNAAVNLSASGAPAGTTASLSPSRIPAPGSGSSTVKITVSAGAALGSYPITITGTSGSITHNAVITLTISAQGGINLPAGTGWLPLGSESVFCSVSPGSTYYNPTVGEVDAFDFLSLCQEGTLVAYSGGAVDTTNDRFFLWTSGHNNYRGNEMYELDLKGTTPAVSRITDPAWTVDNTDVPSNCACKGTRNCGQGMWHDGAGFSVKNPYAETANQGPHFESIPAPDGTDRQPSCMYGTKFQPNSRETYAGIVYHAATNKIFTWGGVVASDPAAGGAYSNWSLDLTQKPPKWMRLRDSSYTRYTAAVYDYTANHHTSGHDIIFDENYNLYAYNSSTDAYTVLSNSMPYLGWDVNMELDPIHHSLVLETGNNYTGYHLRILKLDSCNGVSCTITDLDQRTSCQGALGYWAGLAWDSKRSVMTIFPSSDNCSGAGCTPPFNTVYLLNTDPTNPVTITYQGKSHTIQPQQCFAASYGSQLGKDYPPMSIGPGVYSRFKYYPHEDIYTFIPHPNEPVWILRLK